MNIGGSAQLIFNITKFVEYTTCNKTVVIPCVVNNVEAKSLKEMFVKWKFRDTHIFYYNGDKNESKPNSNFSSAYIVPEALLSGIASLKMDKSNAIPGNYTCEVTELTREGETIVELKYRVGARLILTQGAWPHPDPGSCGLTRPGAPRPPRTRDQPHSDPGAHGLTRPGIQLHPDQGCALPQGRVASPQPGTQPHPDPGAHSLTRTRDLASPGPRGAWPHPDPGALSWFSPNENILIVIFPMLAVLLFWGQFGIVTLKYNASVTKEKTILLFVAGLVLTTFVIVGAILFVPAPAIGMSSFSITILILQVLGFVLSVVGLSLCVSGEQAVQVQLDFLSVRRLPAQGLQLHTFRNMDYGNTIHSGSPQGQEAIQQSGEGDTPIIPLLLPLPSVQASADPGYLSLGGPGLLGSCHQRIACTLGQLWALGG
ncbi:hypothetical protein QTO34_014417 [Cnephaeus nilssonii]|uniref:Leukocyte surface antigen CD47 n=1 Tax=Cnephaeus nilssonii TaxID=3371016 RepID=A0AA40I6B8_CNENI|nr:hypothetical protein QTO34_014417 [Eptesicus nilssonii]